MTKSLAKADRALQAATIEAAQDVMLDALIAAASRENDVVYNVIIKEATKMAKRWGITCKPGLPKTFSTT